MDRLLVLCFLFGGVSAQSPIGPCRCGIFVDIDNSGIVPPYTSQVGPIWILGSESQPPLEVPCDDNFQSACFAYCNVLMDEALLKYDYDDTIEVEESPGNTVNATIGPLFCAKSYQVHPDPPSYQGTPAGGSDLFLGIQLEVGNCIDWEIMGQYSEKPLCCDIDYQYFECLQRYNKIDWF